MNSKNKYVRGAVSVFLVMILVPCILVSSIFVDLGRVHMSKSVSQSTADLALNSLLTNYDADLSEWYGMIASCQDIEQFYEISAEFFLKTVTSQDLSAEDLATVSAYYAKMTDDDTIYDLLQMECLTDTADMISEVEGANLSNPTLIKDQIVEFMKYRAPIEIASSLIDKFFDKSGKPTDEANAIIDSDANNDLVEAKQDFYESEGELLKKAFKSYKAILAYEKGWDTTKKTYGVDSPDGFVDMVDHYIELYKALHTVAVELNGTEDMKDYKHPTIDTSASEYDIDEEDVGATLNKEDNIYYLSYNKYESLHNALEEKVEDFEEALEVFEETVSSSSVYKSIDDSKANKLRWWAQMHDLISEAEANVLSAGKAMYKACAKLEVAYYDCELKVGDKWDDINEGDINEDCILDLIDIAYDYYDTYLDSSIELYKNDVYLHVITTLENIASENENKYLSANMKVEFKGKTQTFAAWLKEAATDIKVLETDITNRIKELDIAINGQYLGLGTPSLDGLKNLAKTYSINYENWADEASKCETKMQKEDHASIAEKKDLENLEFAQNVNEESVKELKDRLSNIKTQLEIVKNYITSIKYGGTAIKSIGNKKKDEDCFNKFISCMKKEVKISQIPLSKNDLNVYISDTFDELLKYTEPDTDFKNNVGNPNYDPDLSNNKPKLYEYFEEKFEQNEGTELDEYEKEESVGKEAKKDYKSGKKTPTTEYRGGGTNISPEYSSPDSDFDATKVIGAVAGLVKDIVGSNYDNIRDDLYVATYVTNMFSYATYDREMKYQLIKDTKAEDEVKKITPNNAESEDFYQKQDILSKFESTKLTDTYNKSLTNKMINKDNNAAYLAEIEYILYGESTNANNLKRSFGDIYLIRLALNTISAFQHFWNIGNDTANIIDRTAGAISGLSHGLIPKPVAKAVLLPIYAAVESCVDNTRLSYGMPVELYKSNPDDWWLSIPKGSGSFASITKLFDDNEDTTFDPYEGKNCDKGFFYSDYLTVFVYCGLSSGGTVEENMYKRIAEVIQSNIAKKTGDSGYSLTKARMYFSLKATVRVKPLMIALPIFNGYDKQGMDTNYDWCTYDISLTRGYS